VKISSVATPCYKEELTIRDCYEAVKRVFDEDLKNYQRELIM
jgi:hypothetical protein